MNKRTKALAVLLLIWGIAVLLGANPLLYIPFLLAIVALVLDIVTDGQCRTRPERHVL
jgi:hypothetical protein